MVPLLQIFHILLQLLIENPLDVLLVDVLGALLAGRRRRGRVSGDVYLLGDEMGIVFGREADDVADYRSNCDADCLFLLFLPLFLFLLLLRPGQAHLAESISDSRTILDVCVRSFLRKVRADRRISNRFGVQEHSSHRIRATKL